MDRGRAIATINIQLNFPLNGFYNEVSAKQHIDARNWWRQGIEDAQKQLSKPTLAVEDKAALKTTIANFKGFLKRTETIPLKTSNETSTYEASVTTLTADYETQQNALSKIVIQYNSEVRSLALEK